MTNINFSHQNVLYHVFDISLLSSSKNIDSSNSILTLQKPQIICNTYQGSINQQNLIKNSSIYFPRSGYNNTDINSFSQDTFDELNNIMITQPLLNGKSKMRPRKRYHLRKHLEDSYESIDNITHEPLVSQRPDQTYSQPIMNKQLNPLEEVTNVNQDLEFSTGLEYNSTQSVVIDHPLAISALSKLISVTESEIIKVLFFKGISVTINQIVSVDTATFIARYYGCIVESYRYKVNKSPIHNLVSRNTNTVNTHIRAPIITIAGHLNHGKTSLLCAIQKNEPFTDQVDGITQLIKAHEVYIHCEEKREKVIFLDTPGHKAFSNMRLLSVKITDLIILVIAADEGIDTQTIEVIQYIKTFNIPVLIVINKIDKVNLEIEKIKNNFLSHNAIPKEWKNDVPIVSISATTCRNIDVLSSHIIMLMKQCNLKSNLYQKAKGIVINSFLDKNTGPTARVIVQNGTLNIGDFMVAGSSFGKVRAIKNDQNMLLEFVSCSSVVEICTFSQIPILGSTFMIVKNEKTAKKLAGQQQNKSNLISLQKQISFRITADESTNLHKTDLLKQINIILKTGNQGTTEAILSSFSNISQSKLRLNILSVATGIITETDVKLAIVSKSVVIGFNTIVTSGARLIAKQHKVNIREYEVIDDLLRDIKEYMVRLLEMENAEKVVGTAIVRSVFTLAIGVIAGCIVESGKVAHDSIAEILRNKLVIYKGKLKSLKHMKIDILEVKQGQEFGVSIVGFDAWQINDQIKFYNVH